MNRRRHGNHGRLAKLMQEYLKSSEIIDWNSPGIRALSKQLGADCEDETQVARHCFEWVRDNIRHSWDYQLNPVTCKASDVLRHATGYCYAKSHLLAALLRANRIPAGLCYQRLSLDDNGYPYCLHGLNAVHLPVIGWYRIDARGNKEGINARFCPPREQLAFSTNDDQEKDFAQILSEPLQSVVEVLTISTSYLDVYNNLPDSETIS